MQAKKAHNINLVTPTMYAPQIAEGIRIARDNGLNIPIIYNSNGYENVETIQALNGLIDIYLPDLKYYDNDIAKKYSKINNYFEYATKAILEMYYQVGLPKFDKNGIIKKGIIIRHLVLPNNIDNSKKVLLWIKQNMPQNVYVSLMAQYFPTHKAYEYPEIDRKLSVEEFTDIKKYLDDLGFVNGYFQELGEHEEEFVPNF